jgi:diguanylate cyclase
MGDELFHTAQEIIANFAIVIAFSFIVSQVIFKKRTLGGSLSLLNKIKVGLLSGLLGILLMLFTVSFNNTILDFRQLALILSALVGGGIIPSLITGLIIGIMRLFAFGSITTTAVIATANTTVISLCVGIICSRGFSYWKKWLYSLVICNVLTSITFPLILGRDGLILLCYLS